MARGSPIIPSAVSLIRRMEQLVGRSAPSPPAPRSRHSMPANLHLMFSTTSTVTPPPATPLFSDFCIVARGCTPCFCKRPPFKRFNVQAQCVLPPVPLHPPLLGATMGPALEKGLADGQETSPPLPVSKEELADIGSGNCSRRIRKRMQVVPGSIVLKMDQRAGWPKRFPTILTGCQRASNKDARKHLQSILTGC